MSGDSRELQAVARLSEALFGATAEVESLIERALSTALDELEAESGSVLLADGSRQTLVFRHSLGEQPVPRGTEIPWNKGIAGAVFQSGQAQMIADVKRDPQHLGSIDEPAVFRNPRTEAGRGPDRRAQRHQQAARHLRRG